MSKKIGIKSLTTAAMLTAMSIIIGIFCKNFLNFGGGLFRITFENLPIILSGILFGPIVGGIVGCATDLISYLLSSQIYPPNLIVTLGAALIGVISGVVSRCVKEGRGRIVASCTLAHLVGSVVVKSAGLFMFYGWAIMWRIPLYAVIATVETILICLLYKNNNFKSLMDNL